MAADWHEIMIHLC